MKKWYLVKVNWNAIKEAENTLSIGSYIGLGGNIWPTEGMSSEQSTEIKAKIDDARSYLDIDSNTSIYVVQSEAEALKYKKYASKIAKDVILIEVSIADDNSQGDGYDFGNPEGGYSIIESEILVKESHQAAARYLNKQNGLFKSLAALKEFLDQLGETEDLSSYIPVCIRYLK
jgi:hypothetical protein